MCKFIFSFGRFGREQQSLPAFSHRKEQGKGERTTRKGRRNNSRNNNNKNLDKRALGTRSCFQRMIKLRGGADIIETIESLDVKKEMPSGDNCAIVVSTSVGSVFLDKKKRLSIPRNSTVAELKTMIEKKFPGCPPTGLQRLFLGVRALSDDEIIGNITVTSPTPILLDMLSGTSVYNKTLSISQALEAHAALIVQQSYLGSKLLASYSDIPASIATNDSQNIRPATGQS